MRNGEEFERCEQRMQEMLIAQGHPSSIIWTFYEDYIWSEMVLFVGPIDRVNNSSLSNTVFNDIATYPYGAEISLIAVVDKDSLCAIFAPRLLNDAQYRLIDGIKLSVPVRLPNCKAIANDAEWAKMTASSAVGEHTGYPIDGCMRKIDILDAHR